MRRRLTETDWRTIRRALNDAMDERASYAEAWGADTTEGSTAAEKVKQYEALHQKLFGEASARQQQLDEDDATPSVSIFELMKDPRP